MFFEIDSIKESDDGKTVYFNVYLQTEGFSSIINGWRVIGGRIYGPAIKKKSGYVPVLMIGKESALMVYKKVKAALPPNVELLEAKKAVAGLVPSDDQFMSFVPGIAQKMGYGD
jgi:hypothetical protein